MGLNSGIGHKSALVAALVVSALALVSGEQTQTQLILDVYPSQDNNNQTVWIFSGSSTTRVATIIRTASGGTTFLL